MKIASPSDFGHSIAVVAGACFWVGAAVFAAAWGGQTMLEGPLATPLKQLDRQVAFELGLGYPATPWTELRVPLIGVAAYGCSVCGALLLRRWLCGGPGTPMLPKSIKPVLRSFQALHNLGLCLFSAACFLGTLHACVTEEWFSPRSMGGLDGAICVAAGSDDHIGSALRQQLLYYQLSKYWEFVDTWLLILNGRPVSFLHAYHHSVVALTTWSWVRGDLRLAAGGVLFNTFVHVLMYYYYFVCTVPWMQPPWWKRYLTLLQIHQFIVSLVMAVFFWLAHRRLIAEGGRGCSGWPAFVLSTYFNLSLLILFIDFHQNAYSRKKPKIPANPVKVKLPPRPAGTKRKGA